ncbi:MAG: protein kinase [Alphaproteobacteria bacterium]|nr:protein kinase [Alphaproteobacteria bacterium]
MAADDPAPEPARPAGAPAALQDLPTQSWVEEGSSATWGDSSDTIDTSILPKLGRYSLRAELGRGGMGVVFRAWDPQLGRDVALKVLLAPRDDAGPRARLMREARAMAGIRHPGIVPVYDIGEQDGQVFFAMELVEGPTLAEQLKSGPLPPRVAARVVAELAHALHHVHAQGLVHRDVKPGNVLMDGGVRPRLTDFGLVKELEAQGATLTQAEQMLGTPAYMSPEQAAGALDRLGPASDQFSLGATLFEALAGQRLFRAPNHAEVMRRIREVEALPLTALGVPAPLATICARALYKAPEDRYPDLEHLAWALEGYLRGEDTPRPGVLLRARVALRRHRPALRSLALVALTAALSVAAIQLGSRWVERAESSAHEAEAEQRRVAMQARAAELLAEGRGAEADAAFEAFVGFPGNAETRALGQAWADRAQSLGGATDARDAWARAYALAPDRPAERRALVGLAGVLRAEHDWDGLRQVVAALEPEAAPDPALRALQVEAAISRRELDRALKRSQDPAQRSLLEVLAQATPLPGRWAEARLADEDLDGARELQLRGAEDESWRAFPLTLEGLLGPGREGEPRRSSWQGVLESGEAVSVGREGLECVLRGQAASPLLRWPCGGGGLGAAVGDLDADGLSEIYYATARFLHRLRRGPEGWRADSAHAGTNAANSDITGVVVADLDQDGADELALTASNWGSYDLRVLEADGEALALSDRAQLGNVWFLAPVRDGAETLLATLQVHDPSQPLSYQVFGPELPHGAPAGVYLMRYGAEGLSQVLRAPWPRPPVQRDPQGRQHGVHGRALMAGDLDGDGRDELVLGVSGAWTWVIHWEPDGRLAVAPLDQSFPLAVLNLDEDPDDELLLMDLAGEGRVWALGVGEARLPALDPVLHAPRPPPPALTGALREPWERAEDLVALSLYERAAERFAELALLGAGTPAEALAWRRRAELLELSERPMEAVHAWLRAAEAPSLEVEAVEAALRLLLAERRFEQALQVAERRAGLPEPPEALAAQLRDLEARASAELVELSFAEGIDPLWHVTAPTGLRWDARLGGVRALLGGASELLRLPLAWEGGDVGVELDFEILRADWGTLSFLSLLGGALDSATATGLLWRSVGGGFRYQRSLVCPLVNGRAVPLGAGEPAAEGPLTLAWDHSPGEAAACTALGPEGERGRAVFGVDPERALSEGPLELVLGSDDSIVTALSEVVLRAVRLRGLRPVEQPPSPLEQADLALSLGRPEQALNALGAEAGWQAALSRAFALEDLGRHEEAARALRAALAEAPDAALPGLLLVSVDRHEALLRAGLGRRYVPVFYEAHAAILQAYPEDAARLAPLLRHLEGLERPTAYRLSEAEAEAHVALLTARADAWRLQGRWSLAERDLARAEALTPQLGSARARAERAIARSRALLAIERGELEQALSLLRGALARAASVPVYADVIAEDPRFAPLHALPGWAEIEQARRRGLPEG